MKVIPAILEKNLKVIKAKVALVKPYVDLIQLDVMDSDFVPNDTYNSTEELDELGVALELHLMISHPELHISKWALSCVKSIVVHHEAVGNMNEVIRLIKDKGKKAGVAINPGTPVSEIENYLNDLDLVLVMGVNPGFSGQDFQSDVLEKIKHLKKINPQILIEVDGGVNFGNKEIIKQSGVDVIAVNSALFNDPENIEQNIKQLSS